MTNHTLITSTNPLQVLGLQDGATEDEIRGRYLELVKQFPPDRDADRFREIHAAYEAAKDPLVLARRLLDPSHLAEAPEWSDVIESQRKVPPALSVNLVLSLGNRSSEENSAAKDDTRV